MNLLDDGIVAAWPSAVLDALKRFRQGDLIENPPVSFHALGAAALWVPKEGNRPEADGPVEVEAPYGIITTQTCDITERGPGGQRPFLQLSPVFELKDVADAEKRLDLIPLTSGELPGGVWAADLRIEAPVEKSILAGREPIRGFADEEEAVAFGEVLGRLRDRAALHDVVNDVLYGAWRKKRSNNKNRAKRLFENLHSVGLAIQQGTRLEPIAIQCHFIGRDGSIADDDQEWIEAWWDKASEGAETSEPGLNLLPNVFHDGSKMNLELYDELIPLGGWLES